MINTKNLKHKTNKHKPLNKHKSHLEKRDKGAQCRWTVKIKCATENKESFQQFFVVFFLVGGA